MGRIAEMMPEVGWAPVWDKQWDEHVGAWWMGVWNKEVWKQLKTVGILSWCWMHCWKWRSKGEPFPHTPISLKSFSAGGMGILC